MIKIQARAVSRPLNQVFTIARGSKTSAESVVVTLEHEGKYGRGEGVPYARYGEDVAGALNALSDLGEIGLEDDARQYLPAGAARNALDCALWDLSAKLAGESVATLLGLTPPSEVQTAQTLSLDSPENMAKAAAKLNEHALIKIKLGGAGDVERLRAIRAARPQAELIVDANEGWDQAAYEKLIPRLVDLGVTMIEQPFHADRDGILAQLDQPIPICADESAHTAKDVDALSDRYKVINIKLDKSGGLSEALEMRTRAQAAGLSVMVGCMVGSSLAMAPAYLLTDGAKFVDLDGPLFMSTDEEPKIRYEAGIMHAPARELWG